MLDVVIVPCLKDNYAYLASAPGSKRCVVVDPSEPEPVLTALRAHGLEAVAILATHHHLDHVGGIEGLRAELGELPVYAHPSDRGRVPAQTHEVGTGDVVELGELRFVVHHIPGHTLGAVAYHGHGALFTGDTLFTAGCGRLFEGTPEMMHRSLNVTLGALPDATRVYCGHEYTAQNLRFAATLEPDNTEITRWADEVAAARAAARPTVPSTLGRERAANPYLRCASRTLRSKLADRLAATGTSPDTASDVQVLAAVRAAKDDF